MRNLMADKQATRPGRDAARLAAFAVSAMVGIVAVLLIVGVPAGAYDPIADPAGYPHEAPPPVAAPSPPVLCGR